MIAFVLFCVAQLVAVQDNQTNGFYRLNAEAQMTLTANGFEAGVPMPVSVTICDEFGHKVESRSVRLLIDDKGSGAASVRLKTDRYGFFRVSAKTASGVALPKVGSRPAGCLTYAVVHAPEERRKLDPDDCFFGCYADGPGPMTPWLGMHLVLGNSTPCADSAGAAGSDSRKRDGNWRYGGTAVPGNTYHLNRFCSSEARRYMTARGEDRREAFRVLKDPEGRRLYRETYRTFVLAAKAQFPDRRRIYECFLEPDINVDRPEEVVDGFGAVYDVVKEADPEAIVAGPDLSTVMDVAYHRKLFDLGLAKYIDAFAIHPYCSYPPEQCGFINRLREIDAIVRNAKGHGIPKYATEAGFATPSTKEGERLQMYGLVRKQLILLGEGYRFSYSFYPHDYGSDSGEEHDGDYGFAYNLHLAEQGKSKPQQRWGIRQVSPRPVAPALSAASWYLDGFRSVSCIDYLGGGVHGYAYADSADNVVIALWDYSGHDAEVELPVGRSSIRVADHMGNERVVACAGGVLRLRLGQEPAYVVGPDAAIWGLRARHVIAVDDKPVERAAGETTAVFGTLSEDGELELCPNAVLGLPGVRRTCKAGRFSFPIPIPAGLKEGSYPVMLRFFDGKGRLVSVSGKALSVRAPVAVLSASPVCEAGAFGLNVVVENQTDRQQNVLVEMRIKGVPEARKSQRVMLDGRMRSKVVFTCPGMTVDPFEVKSVEVSTTLESGRRWTKPFRMNFLSAQRVDAVTGDVFAAWTGPRYWSPFPGLKMGFAWSDSHLMVDAIVDDDAFVNDKTRFFSWDGDSLQLALAGEVLETSSANNLRDLLTEAYTENTLALTRNGQEAYRTISFDQERFPAGISADGLLTDDEVPRRIEKSAKGDGRVTLRYRAAFPWRMLGKDKPSAGDGVYFAMCVNDRDPGRNQLSQRHVFEFKSAAPKGFGRVILAR